MKEVFGVIVVILALGVSFTYGLVYEQLYSYSEVFSCGIGKATTAVDNLGTESFFANPASIPNEFSFEFSLLGVKLNYVSLNILRDLSIVASADRNTIVSYAVDLVGKPIYVGLDVGLISFNIPIGDFALSFGSRVLVDFFGRVHNPLSSAGFLDARLSGIANPYVGLGYSFKNVSFGTSGVNEHLKRLTLGINLKVSGNRALFKVITIDDVVAKSNSLVNQEEVLSNFSFSLVPDIGVLYKLPLDSGDGSVSRLNFGISVKDIGGVLKVSDNGEQRTLIPTTFNLGVAYFVDLYAMLGEEYIDSKIMRENYVSLDFHDVFFQKADKDFFRRLHIGFSSKLFDLDNIIYLLVGFGFNGGYPSFGASLKVAYLKISYSVYAEELGVYAGQDPDIRHMFSVSLGW